MTTPYADRYWESPDGLKLHYRDYAGPAQEERVPVLCLHGLTRNARDFADLAEHLAPHWRVIVPELRGRGDSEYAANSDSYNVGIYLNDIDVLLGELGIARFVAIGTSLGGLMTMVMAASNADRIAGALLNDIGPVVEEVGLDAIRDYVGQGGSFPTWMHAARALEEAQTGNFPDYEIDDWIGFAKRTMAIGQNGRIAFDYDMAIAEPFRAANDAEQPDLWPMYEALRGRPVMILRGEHSDLLSEATLCEMLRRLPDAEAVTVPRVGHAPMLDEPASLAAIDKLLAEIG